MNQNIIPPPPPAPSAPTAPAAISPLPEHANAGTVAVEQSRAVAEALGKIQVAKAYPRSMAEALERIKTACSRPSFAKIATYAYPRGGQTISGPSIRLAEELARCYGNIQYGIRELSQRTGISEMQAYAWDLETNTERVMNFTVKHERHTKSGVTRLTDPRDIYEMTANQGGRRVRACILAVIDRDLEQYALGICEAAILGNSDMPLADKIKHMVNDFSKIGISVSHIEARINAKVDSILPDQLGELFSIFNSIKDGFSQASDWFGVPDVSASVDGSGISDALKKLRACRTRSELETVFMGLPVTVRVNADVSALKNELKVKLPVNMPNGGAYMV
jgi:hypothetical protein